MRETELLEPLDCFSCCRNVPPKHRRTKSRIRDLIGDTAEIVSLGNERVYFLVAPPDVISSGGVISGFVELDHSDPLPRFLARNMHKNVGWFLQYVFVAFWLHRHLLVE